VVIDQETVLPNTPLDVAVTPFTSEGGFVVFSGTLAVEFNGTPVEPAVVELSLHIDEGPLHTVTSTFPAAQAIFTVAAPLWFGGRVRAGAHTFTITLRNAGTGSSQTKLLRSIVGIEELQ
jgi:hypothetical protein